MKPIHTLHAVLAVCSFLVWGHGTQAQLVVSPQTDLQQLARAITGPGVMISNPQITCHPQGFGEFSYTGPLLGIDAGVLLTSGTISNAVGPNNVENKTFQQQTSGSPLLNTVTGRTTYDACKFEFDVIPAGDSLRFDFVFGSEEYNEWVGSQYNDVFGFFISGPGITGDAGIGNDHNIALIPGTSQAVTINNVNNGSNQGNYFDNAGGQFIQYDGFTKGLSAFSLVQPCQSYHLKLVVADASDRKFDSGVFIAKVKSNPVTMKLITQSGIDSLIEGCNNGKVRFTRETVTNQPLILEYYLQGTAINGTDYAAIGNINPALPKTITIPANQAFADQPITTIVDAVQEPLETLLFILGNPNCPTSFKDTLVVPLVDSLTATIQPTTSIICQNGQVQLLATGGSQYTWTPALGLSAANISNPVASPSSTRSYSVLIQDGGCSRTLVTTVKVSSINISASVTTPLCNGGSNGAINLTVGNGIPPYSFQWSGPNGYSATTEDISGIQAGTYTVSVTDAACTKTQSFNVDAPPPLAVALTPSMLIFGQNISCSGGHDGSITTTITGGTGPYTASWIGPTGYSAHTASISGLGAGAYSVLVTDAGGCTANANSTLVESAPMVASITGTTAITCANDGSGSATVTINGGMPNYTYAWNTVPVQTGSTASNLSPGTYIVTATDQYGCTASAPATITGPAVPLKAVLAAKVNVKCNGAATGSATAQISGGTAPYTINWNTTPVQSTLTATGLSSGSYTATITDAKGCSTSLAVTITEPSLPLAISTTTQQNIGCWGQNTGNATVLATGGSSPYAYTWNTIPVQYGAAAAGLAAGTYTISATDAQGCQTNSNVVITAPASALSASISSFGNVLCANGNDGTATVVANGGTPPYTTTWNTTPAQASSTVNNLTAGTWLATVQDANHCTVTATATIAQPGGLQATGIVSPAQCQGAANGAVDVTTTSGTPPYTWAWTGPSGYTATTEDISSLVAGGYTLVITDAHGCSLTRSFDVNQPGLFTATLTPAIHGIANLGCAGGNDGAISLQVSGAVPPYNYAWQGPNGYTANIRDIVGLAAGAYSVTITDHNGCSTSLGTNLTAPPTLDVQLTTSNYGGSAIACNGGANGSISTTISGGNPTYNTTWTGPSGYHSTQLNPTGLTAGTYQVVITDANACTTTQAVTLSAPAPLIATNGGTSPAGCFGSATGQATIQVTGGHAPYSYNWNTVPVQHTATATGLATGAYSVSIFDATGCTTSTSISVGGPASPLAINITGTTPVLCYGGHTGSATAQATGGTAPYAYTWNSIPATGSPSITGLPAGTWTVTASDAAGCTVSRNVVITQPAQPLAATLAAQQAVTCFGDANGSAAVIATGGSGNYNITWNTLPTQSGSAMHGAGPGNYVATVADANGCPQVLNFPVTISGPISPLQLSFVTSTYNGGANVSCTGAHDGSIDLTVMGGTPGYTYAWQDGHGNTLSVQDPTGLQAGSYHISVTDAHGCAKDTTITLSASAAITATAAVNPALCHGGNTGSVTLAPAGGVPPYAFHWNGPNGFSATSKDLASIPAGVYTVLITDANGCYLSQPFDVTEPGTFAFNASTTPVNCSNTADGTILLSALGGTPPYQYSWTGPNAFTATGANITGLMGGIYHMVLTDANGCSALFSQEISSPPPLTLFAISNKNHNGTDISCAGAADGSISTTCNGGTAPYTYSWNGPNGFTATTANLTGLVSGTYTLVATDAHGCSRTASVTLSAPPALVATVAAGTFAGGSNTSCAGASNGSLILTPAGGTPPYNVAWGGPGGYTSNSWQITGLAPGLYTATVVDQNGCTTTLSRTLAAPAPLALATTAINASCFGATNGSINITATGGSGTYNYIWSGPNAFNASSQAITQIPSGVYAVVVSDANGCTATAAATISQPAAIQATATTTTAACQGANTGAIDLSVTGGTGAYSYLWTGFPAFSATTQDISALFAGVYSVAITDANGCTLNTAYNVGEPGQFSITAQLSNTGGGYNVSCASATDGAITASVAGGNGPLTYFWTGPNGFSSISLNLSGLAAGEYQLTVHDGNGCNATASFTLVAPAPIAIGLIPTGEPSCDGGQDGSIEAAIQGGTAPYSVTWTGPNGFISATQHLTGASAGTYSITVTDALGCVGNNSIALTSPAGISATAVPQVLANGFNLGCAGATDGSINLTIDGGTMPYSVTWHGPSGYQASSVNISALSAGLYTALITDAKGCSFSTQTQINAPAPLLLSISTSTYSGGNQVSCAGASDGTISLSIAGGSPGYMIAWNGPGGFSSTQPALQHLQPGTYQVVVTDFSGCSASASATLVAPSAISTTALLSNFSGFEVGCDGTNGSIALTTTGGLAPYSYNWTGPNGFASTLSQLDLLAAGTYNVAISDANSCMLSRSFTLNAPPALALDLIVTSNECDVSNNGSIHLQTIGGTAPFTYAWTGPNGFSFAGSNPTGLASGTYTATVTTAIGCIATASATVIAASPILMHLYASSYGAVNIPCNGASTGAIELNVAGGFTPLSIAWNGPDGYAASTANINGLAAGTYDLTIIDGHGCVRDTSVTLIAPDSLLTTVLSGTDIPCTGSSTGSVASNVSGGLAPYTFNWRGPDSTMYSTANLSGIPAGTYNLVVTDGNQCVNTLQITLVEPDSALSSRFDVPSHNGFGTTCAGTSDGAINYTASGGTPGYSVHWSGPSNFTSTQDSISGLAPGIYQATVTDALGCTVSNSIHIMAPPAISLAFSSSSFPGGSPISCHGMNDGAITSGITGGVPSFSMQWSGPNGFNSTLSDIDSLLAGTYCLSVVDTNGCTAQACITLVEPPTLGVSLVSTAAACGLSTGSVDANITGGSTPYHILWSNGGTAEDLTAIMAGTYSIEVNDANGCTALADATVQGSAAVAAQADIAEPLCHASMDGSIHVMAIAGQAPFTYTWGDGSSNPTLINACAGLGQTQQITTFEDRGYGL